MANDKTDGMTDDCTTCQKPQAPEDKHAPGYDNDVPATSWLRSDGEKKPGFDKSKGRR